MKLVIPKKILEEVVAESRSGHTKKIDMLETGDSEPIKAVETLSTQLHHAMPDVTQGFKPVNTKQLALGLQVLAEKLPPGLSEKFYDMVKDLYMKLVDQYEGENIFREFYDRLGELLREQPGEGETDESGFAVPTQGEMEDMAKSEFSGVSFSTDMRKFDSSDLSLGSMAKERRSAVDMANKSEQILRMVDVIKTYYEQGIDPLLGMPVSDVRKLAQAHALDTKLKSQQAKKDGRVKGEKSIKEDISIVLFTMYHYYAEKILKPSAIKFDLTIRNLIARASNKREEIRNLMAGSGDSDAFGGMSDFRGQDYGDEFDFEEAYQEGDDFNFGFHEHGEGDDFGNELEIPDIDFNDSASIKNLKKIVALIRAGATYASEYQIDHKGLSIADFEKSVQKEIRNNFKIFSNKINKILQLLAGSNIEDELGLDISIENITFVYKALEQGFNVLSQTIQNRMGKDYFSLGSLLTDFNKIVLTSLTTIITGLESIDISKKEPDSDFAMLLSGMITVAKEAKGHVETYSNEKSVLGSLFNYKNIGEIRKKIAKRIGSVNYLEIMPGLSTNPGLFYYASDHEILDVISLSESQLESYGFTRDESIEICKMAIHKIKQQLKESFQSEIDEYLSFLTKDGNVELLSDISAPEDVKKIALALATGDLKNLPVRYFQKIKEAPVEEEIDLGNLVAGHRSFLLDDFVKLFPHTSNTEFSKEIDPVLQLIPGAKINYTKDLNLDSLELVVQQIIDMKSPISVFLAIYEEIDLSPWGYHDIKDRRFELDSLDESGVKEELSKAIKNLEDWIYSQITSHTSFVASLEKSSPLAFEGSDELLSYFFLSFLYYYVQAGAPVARDELAKTIYDKVRSGKLDVSPSVQVSKNQSINVFNIDINNASDRFGEIGITKENMFSVMLHVASSFSDSQLQSFYDSNISGSDIRLGIAQSAIRFESNSINKSDSEIAAYEIAIQNSVESKEMSKESAEMYLNKIKSMSLKQIIDDFLNYIATIDLDDVKDEKVKERIRTLQRGKSREGRRGEVVVVRQIAKDIIEKMKTKKRNSFLLQKPSYDGNLFSPEEFGAIRFIYDLAKTRRVLRVAGRSVFTQGKSVGYYESDGNMSTLAYPIDQESAEQRLNNMILFYGPERDVEIVERDVYVQTYTGEYFGKGERIGKGSVMYVIERDIDDYYIKEFKKIGDEITPATGKDFSGCSGVLLRSFNDALLELAKDHKAGKTYDNVLVKRVKDKTRLGFYNDAAGEYGKRLKLDIPKFVEELKIQLRKSIITETRSLKSASRQRQVLKDSQNPIVATMKKIDRILENLEQLSKDATNNAFSYEDLAKFFGYAKGPSFRTAYVTTHNMKRLLDAVKTDKERSKQFPLIGEIYDSLSEAKALSERIMFDGVRYLHQIMTTYLGSLQYFNENAPKAASMSDEEYFELESIVDMISLSFKGVSKKDAEGYNVLITAEKDVLEREIKSFINDLELIMIEFNKNEEMKNKLFYQMSSDDINERHRELMSDLGELLEELDGISTIDDELEYQKELRRVRSEIDDINAEIRTLSSFEANLRGEEGFLLDHAVSAITNNFILSTSNSQDEFFTFGNDTKKMLKGVPDLQDKAFRINFYHSLTTNVKKEMVEILRNNDRIFDKSQKSLEFIADYAVGIKDPQIKFSKDHGRDLKTVKFGDLNGEDLRELGLEGIDEKYFHGRQASSAAIKLFKLGVDKDLFDELRFLALQVYHMKLATICSDLINPKKMRLGITAVKDQNKIPDFKVSVEDFRQRFSLAFERFDEDLSEVDLKNATDEESAMLMDRAVIAFRAIQIGHLTKNREVMMKKYSKSTTQGISGVLELARRTKMGFTKTMEALLKQYASETDSSDTEEKMIKTKAAFDIFANKLSELASVAVANSNQSREEAREVVKTNIKKLKESEKSEQDKLAQTIEMFKKEGLTDDQISQILGIDMSSVSSSNLRSLEKSPPIITKAQTERDKSEQDKMSQTIEMFKKEGLTDKQISQVLGIPYYSDSRLSKKRTETQKTPSPEKSTRRTRKTNIIKDEE